MSDSQILEGYPDISAADLVAAWAYARANATEIEAALRAQDESEIQMTKSGLERK